MIDPRFAAHEEEDHIDWIEAQLDQIGQMGAPNDLAEQVR